MLAWLENRLVYHPVRAKSGWVPAPSAAIRDVHFPSALGTAVHGWYLPPPGEAPVLFLCHGNADNLSTRGETLLKMRRRLGVGVFIFDYPGYGHSAGKPSEPACYAAAEGALQWLTEVASIPPTRHIFYGESLGGGVATEMARRHPCMALILVKTFTSLPAAAKRLYPWLPVAKLMRNRFENIAKVEHLTCPVLLAKATADEIVPSQHTDELFAKVTTRKELFAAEGAKHNDSLPDSFWPTLRQFLQLPEPPPF